MKKIIFIFSLLFLINNFVSFSVFADTSELIIHVSPIGNDNNTGTIDKPLATLNGARVFLRKIDHSKKRVTVLFHTGEYYLEKGIVFDSQDSGTEEAPITYKSAGDGEVVFNGAKQLDISKFTPVMDNTIRNRLPKESRDIVGQLDLNKQGFTYDMVDMTSKLAVAQTANVLGIYLNGVKQPLSRWPNFGYNVFGNVLQMGGRQRWSENKGLGAVFEYDKTNPARWLQAEDAFIEGYFGTEYAAEWAKIGSIEINKNTITLANWTQYGVSANHRWAAVNLLEEIDIPGEWFIDKKNMILYYYPSYGLTKNDNLEVTILNDPFINAKDTEFITFDSLHFKCTKAKGIILSSTNNIKIVNSKLEKTGNNGIEINSKNTLVEGCSIYETGGSGVNIIGGSDAQRLIPGGNRIANNHIYRFNLNSSYYDGSNYGIIIGKFGTGAVIGDIVENNLIHGGWDANGIQYGGNDNIIRYNEIYNISRNVADSGAINSGRRLNEYGNKIKYNYIHDFGSLFSASYSTCGIYWDDWQSGQLAENNIIVGNGRVNTQGNILVGADNIYCNNIIVNVPTGVSLADRNKYNNKLTISDPVSPLRDAYNTLLKIPQALMTKYPKMNELKNALDKRDKFVVSGNVVTGNISAVVKGNSIDDSFYQYSTVENNQIVDTTDIFIDPSNHDYRVKKEAMMKYNFSPQIINEDNFSMDKIGIQKEVYNIQKPNASFYQLYPKNGQQSVQSQSLVLIWEQALYADEYEYIIATDPYLSNIVKRGKTIENFVSIDNLENGKSYYWKVKARNISKQIASEWGSVGEPYLFTIAQYDDLNKTFLKDAIAKAEVAIEDVSEKTEGVGEYKIGTKDKFLSKIEEAKKVNAIKVGKQSDIDKATVSMKKAIDNLQGSKYLGNANLKVGNCSNWIANLNDSAVCVDENNGVKLKKSRAAVFALNEKISNYEVQHFKIKINYDGWTGLALKQKNPNVNSYSKTDSSYLIIIKKDIFELQKYKPGAPVMGIVTTASNGIIEDGKWCDIEFGAVNVEGGVELLFKVNGKIIFDYYDNETPNYDEGYFVITPPNENGSITIAPADNIPEGYYEPPKSLFEKNAVDGNGDVYDNTSKEFVKQGVWEDSGKLTYDGKKLFVSNDVNAKAIYNLAGERKPYTIYYHHTPIEGGDVNASILCRYTDGNSGTKTFTKEVNFSDGESGWKEIGVFEFTSANAMNGNIDIEVSGSGEGKIISPPIKLVSASESSLKFSKLFYRDTTNLLVLKIGKANAFKDCVSVNIPDTTPAVVNQSAMLPIRFVIEELGGKVLWNEEDKSLTITLGDNVVVLYLNESAAIVNGNETIVEQMPIIKDDRILVPLSTISHTLGKNIIWDEKRGLVFIGDNLFGISDTDNFIMDLVDKAFEGDL